MLDLEKKQWQLSWKKFRKILQGKPADKRAESLFERAEREYTRTHGKLPGRGKLRVYAKHLAQKLGLPSRTKYELTDARAKKYMNQRKRLLDDGDMTVDDYVNLWKLDDAESSEFDN